MEGLDGFGLGNGKVGGIKTYNCVLLGIFCLRNYICIYNIYIYITIHIYIYIIQLICCVLL